ncbi:response regulator [Sediminispirochaeta bajacaliforniensis]|uniref:response regulator n=1 Tax=Sediminispirochaeta bajacaliforniensis TaxID=148 RepID=UPI000371D9C6|nr:response regulator [Sediminispirochaeta bajacaliforniensis]
MDHTILFVDDEENILKALGRLMRKTGYTCFFASSAKEGLEIIKKERLSVIVSDMRMPEMNGVELVRAANEIDPLSVKIILSGYSDIDDIMSAVNGGHIHSYITKPWREADLMITLMNACEMYERRIREKEMLQELKEKNEALKELNENLEKIVQARTWEIKASNLLLNSILKGTGEQDILEQGALIISKLAGNVPVLAYSLVSGNSFTSQKGVPPVEIGEKILDQLKKSLKAVVSGADLYIPLLRRDRLLGILSLTGAGRGDVPALLHRMANVLSGIRLYLSQQELVGSSSEIISSIDMMIEEADAAT